MSRTGRPISNVAPTSVVGVIIEIIREVRP
jgi:hypothetical protein